MKKVFLYVLFAFLASCFNLVSQWPFFFLFQGEWVPYAALFTGTIIGLFIKYHCDKRWIFCFQTSSSRDDLSRFALYTLMGGLTTVIFWGTELTFYYLFDFSGAQYVGGALGLLTGYTLKYRLDKKFVFREVA